MVRGGCKIACLSILFEGSQGTGKSLCAVAMAYEQYESGRKVISNNHLNFPYTHFDIAYFVEQMSNQEDQGLENCILLLDEAYQYMDSRLSQTKINKLFTYFIVQTRKRDVDLYVCTHHIDHLDVRLRRAIDCRGVASYYEENPCKKCKGVGQKNGDVCPHCLGKGVFGLGLMRFRWVRRRGRARRFNVEVPGPLYWDLYSTKERIPLRASQVSGIDALEVI